MASFSPLLFGQLNVGRGRAATALISSDSSVFNLDIVCLQEPYTLDNRAVGFGRNFTPIFGEDPKAAIFLKSHLKFKVIFMDCFMNVILLENYNCIVVNVYIPPSSPLEDFLNHISSILLNYPHQSFIICGDFNAKNRLWGGDHTDERGIDLLAFINGSDLSVLNFAGSIPTFYCSRGRSWIDLTLFRGHSDLIDNWRVVDQETGSDHRLICFSLVGPLGEPLVTPSRYSLSRVKNWIGVKSKLYSTFVNLSLGDLSGPCLDDKVLDLNSRIVSCFPVRHDSDKACTQSGASWWNSHLASLRSRVRALRRRFQKEQNPDLRSLRRKDYCAALAKYKREVLRVKRASWRKFLDKISVNNSLKDWEFLLDNNSDGGRRHKICHPVNSPTNNISDSIRALLDFHFPQVDDVLPSFLVNPLAPPPITVAEVDLALSESNLHGAPGPDGIAFDVLAEMMKINELLFIELFNACLVSHCLPSSWLGARVVFLVKFGKDPTVPSSYRPICLLNSISKLFERILANRLSYLIYDRGSLSASQYGFVRGSSTIQAIEVAHDFISERRSSFQVSMIALDVKNAFNSLRWSDIISTLINLDIPTYLINMFRSYFGERFVFSEQSTDGYIRRYNMGAPQGSILAPIFWNLVLDSMLKLPLPMDCCLLAYADDILLLVGDTSTPRVALKANKILEDVDAWCSDHDLSIDVDKTFHMFFPKRGTSVSSHPRVALRGRNLKRDYHLKYLGLYFDPGLTWLFHLNAILDKTQIIYHRLLRIASKSWGITPAVRKKLYLVKIEPIIMYGVQVWWRWGGGERMKILLDKIQRPFLLAITRSFRTVATRALQVMAGVPPLFLRAELLTACYGIASGHSVSFGQLDLDVSLIDIPLRKSYLNPLSLTPLSWSRFSGQSADLLIFTDGSGINGCVGSAFVAFSPGGFSPLFFQLNRLSDDASVFQAELVAINLAIRWSCRLCIQSINIISDCRSALDAICSWHPKTALALDTSRLLGNSEKVFSLFWTRSHIGTHGNEVADSLAKSAAALEITDYPVGASLSRVKSRMQEELVSRWDTIWRSCSVGRPLFDIWPRVSLDLRIGNFYLSQLATGHGGFPSYFNKFLGRCSSCRCGEPDADRYHYIFCCPLLNDIRDQVLPAVSRGCMDVSLLFNLDPLRKGLCALMSFIVSHEDLLFNN